MTGSLIDWLMSPWPQWRTHWSVPHAWPVGAQVLLLSVCSLMAMVAGSAWVSAQAWESWWQAEERAQQTRQDLQILQQKVQQQRTRIANLQTMPHPGGFAISAWQTWPDDMPADHKQVLRAWLTWGRQHGLAVQADHIDNTSASGSWTGSLPQLLAAWHGLPTAIPRLAVTRFEWRARADPLHITPLGKEQALWLRMQWVVLKERHPATDLLTKPPTTAKPATESMDVHSASSVSPQRLVSASPGASLIHDPFSGEGMKKALPMVAWKGTLPLYWQTRPLSQMRWVGMLANVKQRQALVQSEGRVQSVRVGDRLGQDWGVVIEIERDHLRLREWVADSQGKWVSQDRRFPAGAQP